MNTKKALFQTSADHVDARTFAATRDPNLALRRIGQAWRWVGGDAIWLEGRHGDAGAVAIRIGDAVHVWLNAGGVVAAMRAFGLDPDTYRIRVDPRCVRHYRAQQHRDRVRVLFTALAAPARIAAIELDRARRAVAA